MKRQAEGVSCESETTEQPETNGNKRIKLLKNEENEGKLQRDPIGEKPVMDGLHNESNHNHGNHSSSFSKNVLCNDHNALETDAVENHPENNTNEHDSIGNNSLNDVVDNCNGSHGEAVSNAADSDTASELCYMTSNEEPALCSEKNMLSEDQNSEPPVLNHYDHDLHNTESTDSFQSRDLEAENNVGELNSQAPDKAAIPEHNSDQECESHVQPHTIDADNITLSHLTVTELQGHTEKVFSVVADEDFVLSSSADTTVKVWNMEYYKNISTFSGHSDSVTSVLLLNPNQSKILKKKMSLTKVSRIAVTGSLDCHIKLWSVLEGKELASVYTFNGITCLGYLESECLVIVGTEGGKLELWNVNTAKAIISVRAHDDVVTDIKVKDNYIHSVSIDGTIKVWCYEDDDIYPVYTRKRKEISPDKSGLQPAHWKTISVSNNIMYLGDNTNNIKVLDWRAGRLSLFKNQIEDQGICECIVAESNMLFSAFYNSSTDSGGVNVWKLPEMAYVCTLTGAIPYVSSLAVVQKDNKLKIVSGGEKLLVSEFDFSKPPSSESEFSVLELETLGQEINEKSVEVKKEKNDNFNISIRNENVSNNKWCNIM